MSRREMFNRLAKKAEDEGLINQIQEIRTKNNKSWMDILRLAVKHSPVEAKALLKEITKNDREVSKLTARLAARGLKK